MNRDDAERGFAPSQVQQNRYRVAPPGRMGEDSDAVSSEVVTWFQAGAFGTTTVNTVRICASCNAVMHKAEEVGGVCRVCNRLLCVECAKLKCAICEGCVCRAHSSDTSKGRICETHGFLAVLGHLFFSKPKIKTEINPSAKEGDLK